MGEFRLEAVEFQGLARWRWVLTGPDGKLVADHEVRLDPADWQFAAFSDLLGYLRWHVAPDRRISDEARIVAEVGQWIGTEVLGPVAEALYEVRPATVQVVVPAEATALVFCPLELGHVRERSLAVRDVTLVMQPGGGEPAVGARPVGERLRVLGLFSLPVGGQPLNLRRERHALVRLMRKIGAVDRAVDVRVLQYGVTRGRLREMLEEAEGWDVIHISGHGAPGELLLETSEGLPDPVPAGELTDLLELARERLKLVTVSACWSAALTAAERRQLLGLPVPDGSRAARGRSAGAGLAEMPGTGDRGDAVGLGGDGAAGALAAELAGGLGCAVLAMRYPVTDEFAISLAARLYELLAAKGQPLPRALGMAMRQVVTDPPTAACPALSAATPTLFGTAAGLTLAAPSRAPSRSYDTGQLKLAGFPVQPDRFVGRTTVMARASAALAAESGIPGVLLHGMPGGGKTACAVELAYTHEHAFEALVWYKAPDEGADIREALTAFALTLENELPGFQMVHLLQDPGKLAAFTPRLTELLEQARLLIVVDNIESLLSETGQWRDARWGRVVGALAGHGGLGRVLLTSRRVPAGLNGRVRVLAVDALSLDEALLLTRELPHLDALIGGTLPGLDPEAAQPLAVRVLDVAQGHPKLLELAEGQAADPARLAELVETGSQAWQEVGGLPEGFFATGEPHAADGDYLHVLGAWTQAVAAGLTPEARDVFWFLCCLEENDRAQAIAAGNWASLWARLGRAGDLPGLDAAVAAVASAGLAAVEAGEGGQRYAIHPGVAATARAGAGDSFRDAVDAELAAFWEAVAGYAQKHEGEQQASGMVVRAGLSAAPYLLRLRRWRRAGDLLGLVFQRDRSRAVAGAALPLLLAITAAVAGTDDEPEMTRWLAMALEVIDPAAAEVRMRAALAAAIDHANYFAAGLAAGDLIWYCLHTGRLTEALTLADQTIGYSRQAGLGSWTQLADQGRRLQVLAVMGRSTEVLAEVHRLRADMDTLPATSVQPETVVPWSVREGLLDTGRQAALQLSRWQDALDLNAEIAASMRDRGAPDTEIARSRFNDYGPLLRLGRTEETLAVLLQCREVFEAAGDTDTLGKVFSALAGVEDKLGRGQSALGLERDALRYKYLVGDPATITVSHHNLGNYLARHARQPSAALAHHSAAALIRAITGGPGLKESVRAAADDLRALGADSAVPADMIQLHRQVCELPGVDLNQLLGVLTTPEAADQALQDLLTQIRRQAAAPPVPPHPAALAVWDPVIAALLAARDGDRQAADYLTRELARYQDSSDWAALAAALRRIQAGDTGSGVLTGLDPVNAAVAARALGALAGQVGIPAGLWPAIPIRWLLGAIVAAARDAAVAAQARQGLDELAAEHPALVAALGQILDGDRDPSLVAGLNDPIYQAIVDTVLKHAAAQTQEP